MKTNQTRSALNLRKTTTSWPVSSHVRHFHKIPYLIDFERMSTVPFDELVRILSTLPHQQAEAIVFQAVAEMLNSPKEVAQPEPVFASPSPSLLASFELPSKMRTERRSSVVSNVSTGTSACSSSGRYVPIWEMQAPLNTMNLSSLLEVIEGDSEECILTVRKIHRLGFKSARALRKHFSQFGRVDKILLLPSRPKIADGEQAKPRPASMGFIVMESVGAAASALSKGDTHEVAVWQIQVQQFHRRDGNNSESEIAVATPSSSHHQGLDQSFVLSS